MRAVSRKLFSILNAGQIKSVMFLDIQLVGQDDADVFHFTDAQQAVTWNGIAYQPISMQRGSIEEKVANQSESIPAMVMQLNNVDRQMAAILARTEFESSTATLWLADRRLLSNPRDAVCLTMGEVQDVVVNKMSVGFKIVTVIGQQERITIPRRVYQPNCNYVFGDSPHCGVDINHGVDANGAPIQLQSNVQAGSSDKFIVVPTSVAAAFGNPSNFYADFFATGYIAMIDGVVGLQDRPINSVEAVSGGIRFWLGFPLSAVPGTGDSVLLRRNCKLNKSDCALFHNGDPSQYGGFEEVPPSRFKPHKNSTPTNGMTIAGPLND